MTGLVYEDRNRNGIFDLDQDRSLPGVAVTITDSGGGVYGVTTDTSGLLSQAVAAGSTEVDIDLASAGGGRYAVTLTTNDQGEGENPSTVVVPSGETANNNTGLVLSPLAVGRNIPTLSEWAMLVLMGMMLMAGAARIRQMPARGRR